jgi:hypothetical protein
MDVFCCECCVLLGEGLCDGPITRPEESYRVWCVWMWSWSLDNEEVLAHWGLSRHWGRGWGGWRNNVINKSPFLKPSTSQGIPPISWKPTSIQLVENFNETMLCVRISLLNLEYKICRRSNVCTLVTFLACNTLGQKHITSVTCKVIKDTYKFIGHIKVYIRCAPRIFSLGRGDDPEAIYNLCSSLKIMLYKCHKHNCSVTLFVTAFIYTQI